jgi:hypothetical protein
MSKKTAVQWLYDELSHCLHREEVCDLLYKLEQKALQMEREQMKLIYDGLLQNVGTSIKESDLPTFEQYYNETFEK